MDIPSLDDYYLKNGQFVLKSSFSKALRYGMMIGIIIGGIFATSTKATVAYLEPYTWQFTKSKYTDYILAANKNVSNRDAVSIVNSIFKWSEHFNIKPELLFAIAKVESRFDKHAISSAGAMGQRRSAHQGLPRIPGFHPMARPAGAAVRRPAGSASLCRAAVGPRRLPWRQASCPFSPAPWAWHPQPG